MIRCIVVDDEMPAINEIKYMLNEIGGVEIVAEAYDMESAKKVVCEFKPDAVFLDINLGSGDGIELAEIITKEEKCPSIVFVTAYDDYAIKAFEVNAIDYILKPINSKRLSKALNKIRANIENKEQHGADERLKTFLESYNKKIERISVYANGKYIPLEPEIIYYITTDGRNTLINTEKGEYITSLTLSELENKFKDYNLFRTHRSYLLNLNHVKEVYNWFNGTLQVVVAGSEERIPVSRNKVCGFKDIMGI
ncbi:MAG TPA: LytTR family DNA-binding domain-containing protein [Clostridia bacterium]|nr:LytTR family DNA-binding domain-containing protein [Clostridia bacterium]